MAMKVAPANSGVLTASSRVTPALPTPKNFTTGFPAAASRSFCPGFSISVVSRALQKTAKHIFDAAERAAQPAAPLAPAVFQRAIFDEADGGGEFRLVERGGDAAHGTGVAVRDVHLEDALRQFRYARHARTAAAEKNSGAQIIGEAGLFEFVRDDLKQFFQPQRHDVLQMFQDHGLEREAEFIGDADGLALGGLRDQRGTMFAFQFFRAAQWNFQAVGEVVGNMVAAHRQHASVPDNAVGINHVFRRAAADVNDQRTEFFLLAGEQRERGGDAVEDNFVHFQLCCAHETDGVLQPVRVAVDDVHVHFQTRAQHADGIGHAVLTVHKKMLAHGVNDGVLGGQVDRLRVLDDVLHIIIGNFPVGGNHGMHAAVAKAANVATSHAEIDAADLHVGHLLGLEDRRAHLLLHLFGVADFAFAHAAGQRLSQADDVDRALGILFADDDADFRRADLRPDDNVGIFKHFFSNFLRV